MDAGNALVKPGVMGWLSEMSLHPDWLDECGFGEQTPEFCFLAEDGEGDVLGATASTPGLPLFASEPVRNPASGVKADGDMRKTCEDVIFYAGGSVWALDWCPRRAGWPSQNEFLVVGAHPRQSPHRRLGEPLRGKGLLQIWAINIKSRSLPRNDNTHNGDDRRRGRPRGRGSGRVSDDVSDDDSDTGLRGKSRGRGRGRGRGRTKAEGSDDECEPGSSPEPFKGRAEVASVEAEASPSSSPGVALPKMVLGIAHEGEVAWDAKWRPVADDADERESMRLGFLAVILGDGSVEVFDVPLPSIWEGSGAVRKESDPLIVKMTPVFRSLDLQSNGHKSIPLSVEWSTWAPYDMLLVGCHDGTVAVFKVFPCSTPLQESRPLLFYPADFMTLRAVAWAPANCGSAGKHMIATAGHSGWVRFWDLRDPYQPVYELQISRGVVTCIDWVSDPRCILITMDDGSVRVFSLDKAATDSAVTGKPYTGTPTQGLASYYSSYYAMWGVHVSRQSGLVAYCGTDGNVLQFQLTERALIKEGSRYREPHFLCGVFAADSETGTIYVISQASGRAARTGLAERPQFRRDFLTRRKAVLKSNGAGGAGLMPSGNPLDMEKPGNKKKKAEQRPPKSNKKGNDEMDTEEPQSLPARIVAVQRLRWNCNKGKETWLAFGGAAGIIRCQYISPRES